MATSTGSSLAVCCPICYREYSDSDSDLIPRILHCGHSYCTECLQRLLEVEGEESDGGLRDMDDMFGFLGDRDRRLGLGLLAGQWGRRIPRPSDQVTCPVCKSTNHIQDGEVMSLTKNFALLGVQDGAERASQHYCQEHDHEQRIYCEECKQLVCAYCQLYGRHKTHNCLIAIEACAPAVEAVRELQVEVEAQLEELKTAEASVVASVQRLEHGRKCNERRISYYYGRLIEALQQKKEAEVDRVQTWSDEQAYILQAQLRSLSGARKTCSRLLEDCRRIAECDPLQALYEQEPLTNRAQDMKTACKGLPHDPIITPHIYSTKLPGSTEHLQALMTGLTVTMSLNPTDQEEEEEEEEELAINSELVGSLVHAQDTQGSADQQTSVPKLDAIFPVDPSPSLASPSTPASYSTTPRYGTTSASLYSTHPSGQSPTLSEDSSCDDGTGEEEFKDLRLRPPLPFLMPPPVSWPDYHHSLHQRLSQDESAELADDELEQDVLLEQRHPVPPPTSLPVPSIPPTAGFSNSQEDQHRVSVSIAGQGLHISVSGSSWPHLTYPSSVLLDNSDTVTVEDSD